MTTTEQPWRRPYPSDVPMERLLDTLPEGTGISIYQVYPFWDVVARRRKDTRTVIEFFIVEYRQNNKPIRVSEPSTNKVEVIKEAESNGSLWRALHVSQPEWPWE